MQGATGLPGKPGKQGREGIPGADVSFLYRLVCSLWVLAVYTQCLRKKRAIELFTMTSSTVNRLKILSLLQTAINYL